MKKIIFFAGKMQYGGAERVISILANYFSEVGYDVEILQYYKSDCVYDIDSRVHITMVEAETGSNSIVCNMVWIRQYIKKSAEIIISFMASFNMLMIIAAIGLGITIIVADRSNPYCVPANKVLRKLRDFLYEFADGVVFQSLRNQKYFSKRIQNKSTVIFNPVNLGEKTGLALKTEHKKEIVSIGRLMPAKNHDMLIDAFAAIHQDYPDYELSIYGYGDLKVKLEAKCVKLGIGDCVHFPGSVKNIHERIISADIFALTSNYEGMPNGLAEAMCLGLPVISTKVSGAIDLINEENGILIDIGDTKQLEDAFRELLENDEKKNILAIEAVKLADKLSVEKIAGYWIDFINKCSE